MAAIALASEAVHENTSIEPMEKNDWLTDPTQLAIWQGQLVNSCNEINQQLNDIQHELSRNTTPAIPFRLIRAHVGS